VVVSECTVCYRAVVYYILRVWFVRFILFRGGGGALVTVCFISVIIIIIISIIIRVLSSTSVAENILVSDCLSIGSSVQRLDLFAWCVRLSRLLVGFRTHFKSLHFHFISSISFYFQQHSSESDRSSRCSTLVYICSSRLLIPCVPAVHCVRTYDKYMLCESGVFSRVHSMCMPIPKCLSKYE